MSLFRHYWYWFVSVLLFLFLLIGSLRFINYQNEQLNIEARTRTQEILISKKSNLERSLYSRIYYTRGVAALVAIHPTISAEGFNYLVNEYIKNDTVIGTMSLSPNCVISAIFPYEGHEEAIGLNLLEHPERRMIVEKTIETHKTFLAGPVELVEGGMAFISYTPIFDVTKDTAGVFWGLTDIVIKRDELMNEAGLTSDLHGMVLALKGVDGKGEDGEFFWGDSTVFSNNPVMVSVDLPYGNWVLAAAPEVGWMAYANQHALVKWLFIVSALIITILLFIVLKAYHRIRTDACELRAIFRSMDNLIFELSDDGRYLKVAPTNIDLLVTTPEDIIGKSMFDVLETELAKKLQDAITECLSTKGVVVVDYPLEIRGEELWFLARISYKSERSVIYNAYDITRIKKAEFSLKQSKVELMKMNATKDRFFSIVAHDLRNPIGSFVAITNLLLDESFDENPEGAQNLIKSLNETANGLSSMLENLLSWALAQQGKITIEAKVKPIRDVILSVLDAQSSHALMKKVTIIDEVKEGVKAYFDEQATNLILRNLVSNAIKFSRPNTSIILKSTSKIIDNQKFVVLSVSDSGTGIPEENLNNIFGYENTYRKYGTNNESGNGLGLVLCREFAEFQEARIWAHSEYGVGSTFFLALPAVPTIHTV